ncbi:glycoside hydrolase family 28 protein [Botrimarina sp.]|uniref:glycoside hydrolase family 28 protein n=1 Tax=Botrimarina sp. TaxID=2795802 RepID=UPI0032EC2DE2
MTRTILTAIRRRKPTVGSIAGAVALLPAVAGAWSIGRDDVGPRAMPAAVEPIDAPFDMPRLARPAIADRQQRLEGPPRAGAIQPAIDALAAEGGGRVVVPAGEWPTGRIELKTGVELHLEEGCVLAFSGRIEDYLPPVFTRYEGIEVMGVGGLVYAHNQERIALTGRGELRGPDEGPLREARKGLSDKVVDQSAPVETRLLDGQEGRHYLRPYFVCPVDCRDVYVEGVTLRNGPMWNVVAIYCDRVVVRGVRIESRGVVNGDGVNVDSSRNVLIEYCSTNTGDDCYAVKSGRNEDGLRVGRPSENIVVRRCYAEGGYGAFTVGSETAGGVRNVYVHDCLFDGMSYAAYFKTRRPRGGGGRNLLVERVRFRSESHAVFFDMIGSPMYVGELGARLPERPLTPATPYYQDITLRDLRGEAGGEAVKIKGLPESPATRVTIEDAHIRSRGFLNLADTADLTIRDSVLVTEEPTLRLLGTRDVAFENVRVETPSGSPAEIDVDATDSDLPRIGAPAP